MNSGKQINVRIPPEDAEWLYGQMKKNRRSLTGEVVLAIQERRTRVSGPENEKAPEALTRSGA